MTGEAYSEQVENVEKMVFDTIKSKTGKPYDKEKRKGDIIPTTGIGILLSGYALDKYLSDRDWDDEDGDFLDMADKATTRFFEGAGDIVEGTVNTVGDIVDAVIGFFKN